MKFRYCAATVKQSTGLTSQNTKAALFDRFLRCTRTKNLVSISTSPHSFESLESLACPGLFYPTAAQDGILARIRTPGGLLSSPQVRVIANAAVSIGVTSIQVTNRANLQLKLSQALTLPNILQQLQAVGLAAPIPAVDHLRNIMASPTAGIDPQAILDTRPLVRALDRYISSSPELVGLSAKCSIGLDGGEAVSIRQRPNDLILVAHRQGLRLFLNMGDGVELDTGLGCALDDAVNLVAAIYRIYLEHAAAVPITAQKHRRSSKPRLRQLVAHRSLEWFRQLLAPKYDDYPESMPLPSSKPGAQLGIHHQQQDGYMYLGLVLPLGQISIEQLLGLSDLADQYGDGSLRLTPWQNVILPQILAADLPKVLLVLSQLGLSANATDPAGSIVACRGQPGCPAAESNSYADAQQLIQQLIDRLDQPLQIHVSGCAKGCAHPLGSDIALLGKSDQQGTGYEIYLRSGNQTFGQLLFSMMPVAAAIQTIEHLISIYQQQRRTPQESFGDFVQRHSISTLSKIFAISIDSQT